MTTEVSSQEFEDKIKDYLLKNPEVILQSIENYEKKKSEENKRKSDEAILKNIDILNDSSNGMYDGNIDGEEVIVEFFDYNCSYCKKAHEDIQKLVKKIPNLKIIYKNFPILSEQSLELAKISLLIAKNDNKKFQKFHNLILNKKGRVDENDVIEFLKNLGYDYKNIKKKMKTDYVSSKLNDDLKLAEKLSLQGTPAFIVKNKLIFGYVGYNELLNILKN